MNNYSKIFKLSISDAGFILAALTASLYASGTAFFSGFLLSWGIDKTLITKSFHQTLYQGLLTWFDLGLILILPIILFLLILLLSLSIAFSAIIESQKVKKLTVTVLKLFPRNKNKQDYKIHEIKAIQSVSRISYIFSYLFLFMMLIISLLAYSEHSGIKKGKQLMKDIKSSQEKLNGRYISPKSDDVLSFIIISCSQSLCAVAEKNTARLLFIDSKSFQTVGVTAQPIIKDTNLFH